MNAGGIIGASSEDSEIGHLPESRAFERFAPLRRYPILRGCEPAMIPKRCSKRIHLLIFQFLSFV